MLAVITAEPEKIGRISESQPPTAAPPLRVLQVVTSVCAGGLSRYLTEVIRNLDPRLFETHLACTHFPGPHFDEALPWVASASSFSARSQIEKLVRLSRLTRQLKPLVVHAHQEPAALIAAYLTGVPRRLETIHSARYWQQDGHPLLRRLAARCATHHVVSCDAERSLVAASASPDRVRIIHPGLDLGRMSDYLDRTQVAWPEPLPEHSFVIGTVARLEHEKGVNFLVEACPLILKAEPGARFLIVGNGTLRHGLEERCRILGISGKVAFLGHQPQAYRFLGAMDLFVFPSLHESWGLAAIEAMAAGVPVICSDIQGPTSFLTNEQTGLLVAPGNPVAIAEAVLRLRSSPGLRRGLAERAKRQVREKHTLPSMIRQYEQLYGATSVSEFAGKE